MKLDENNCYRIVTFRNAFTMINGTLTEVELDEIITDENFVPKYYRVRTCVGYNSIDLEIDTTKFYDDENCFKTNEPITAWTFYKHQEKTIKKWTMIDGVPTEIDVDVINVWYTPRYTKPEMELRIDNNMKVYDTRHDCLAYNDYKVQLEDGSIVIREGIAKKIALTEEQQSLVDRYIELMKQMNDAKMRIYLDRENDSFYIGNESNVEIFCRYEGEIDTDSEVKIDKDYLRKIDSNIYIKWEEDCFYCNK